MTDIVTDRMVSAADAALRGHNVDLSDREIRAAITAALGAMWRPISEAKLDGTEYQVWGEHIGHAIAGFDEADGKWISENLAYRPGAFSRFAPILPPPVAGGE